jgi:predicted RNA-binding Zn-ribbon protein involved in translation (DUF1610 family)
MLSIALCSNFDCDFVFERNNSDSELAGTPTACPKCARVLITRCPWCRFSLLARTPEIVHECLMCGAEIRRDFATRTLRRTTNIAPFDHGATRACPINVIHVRSFDI